MTEDYRQGYQAALDNMEKVIENASGKIITYLYGKWFLDKIQELKEIQNDRVKHNG